MRFALVNEKKTEPQPKLRGYCAHCGEAMISKCGRTKVWHWAHKSREICDQWWENETEWHRSWKNKFPKDWQEISAIDDTGETHIADVKTPYGLVVEFQHSPMPHEEMQARESFYKNMIWIVDGLRNDLDLGYFRMGLGRNPVQTDPLAYSLEWWGRGKFLDNWAAAKSRVFLDFGDNLTVGSPVVWRLIFFNREKKQGAVAPYPKHILIDSLLRNEEIGVPFLPQSDQIEPNSTSEGEKKHDLP